MSQYTDWLLADRAEASAVASVATSDDGSSFADWPHLSLKSVLETELMFLRGVLLGTPGALAAIHGGVLFHESDDDGGGGVIVSEVLPSFVAELAALTPARSAAAAEAWRPCEGMGDFDGPSTLKVLRRVAAFARKAGRAGSPVLSLSAW